MVCGSQGADGSMNACPCNCQWRSGQRGQLVALIAAVLRWSRKDNHGGHHANNVGKMQIHVLLSAHAYRQHEIFFMCLMKFSLNNEEGGCIFTVRTVRTWPDIWVRWTNLFPALLLLMPGVSGHPAQVQMKFSLSLSGNPTHCCPPVASTAPVTLQS